MMKTTMTKMTKAAKENADRKVNDAIAVLWQVEMELNEAEREYRAALDRLHKAQEERDKLK
jgi:capsule polysaccharide export protein KpsE/RkpR